MSSKRWGELVCVALVVDAVLAVWLLSWQLELHSLVTGSRSDITSQIPDSWVSGLLDKLKFLTVVTIVLFLLWFQRVRDDTDKGLPGRRAMGGQSWSMWWWIIPVVQVVKPYWIAVDIWQSHLKLEHRARFGAAWLPVLGWWVLVLAGLFHFTDAIRLFEDNRYDLYTPDAKPGALRPALETAMTADAWYLAAVAATAAFVLRLTRLQSRSSATSPLPR